VSGLVFSVLRVADCPLVLEREEAEHEAFLVDDKAQRERARQRLFGPCRISFSVCVHTHALVAFLDERREQPDRPQTMSPAVHVEQLLQLYRSNDEERSKLQTRVGMTIDTVFLSVLTATTEQTVEERRVASLSRGVNYEDANKHAAFQTWHERLAALKAKVTIDAVLCGVSY
jgi:hypothetical protein